MLIIVSVKDDLVDDVGRHQIVIGLSDYEKISETEAEITYGQKQYKGKIIPYWSDNFNRMMDYTEIFERIN